MNLNSSKYPLIVNPYDSFMKKHLQHYGYFTGRNVAITRFGYEPKKGYKNDNSDDSDCSSDNESEISNNNLIKNKIDWKNKTKFNDNYKWWLKDTNIQTNYLKDGDYQREPRWPVEMQVLPEKIKHIESVPSEPEPFYVKTNTEEMPMPSTEARYKTIFYYNPINCGYFVRSRVGGNRDGCQKLCVDLPEIEIDSTLMFESRFECGNLMKATKINDFEYELYMRYDLYTCRHTQWFYFQIKNAKPNKEYRFTICNFLKPDSLFNMGMKPLMYSDLDAKNKNIGWRRWGSNIKYYRNTLKSEDENGNIRNLYSLTWTCKFPNANDTYYFAQCYPYTYSNLQDHLKEIQEDPVRNKYCKIKVLCRSLAENLVHLVTITNPASCEEEAANKKAIVITARVHPGETNSSWMMKGFLDFLLGNSPDAKLLRDNFVFKIVPMLNPDGVIIGNYRCSLTGRDLNRNYKTVLKEAFPSIWHTREMVKKLVHERQVILYCDLHGHSRKNNVFIYGCHNNHSPKLRFKEHVFPMILSKNAKDQFSYRSCKFKIQKSKQGTGRIVMWNMGILNSFTMEATFSGSTLNQKAGFHFNTKDLEELGYIFCDSILDYCDPDQTKCKLILNEIEMLMREQYRSKLESQGLNFDQINLIEDFESLNVNFDKDNDSSDGSDSSIDDGLPLHLERFSKTNKLPNSNNSSNNNNNHSQSINNNNINSNNNNNNYNHGSNSNNNYHHNNNISATNVINNINNLYSYNISNNTNSKNNNIESVQNNNTVKANSSQINTVSSVNTEENEKKILRPLIGQNQTMQLNVNIHPKSAKVSTHVPFNTHERAEERAAIKRFNQNAIQLQLDTESSQNQAEGNLLTFRYTLPNEIQYTGNMNPQNYLCEHHRKKLNELFLSEERNKVESDGNASDDEADPNDDYNEEKIFKKTPTLEEYVKKHVFSRSESSNLVRRQRKSRNANLKSSKSTVELAQPLLDIRSIPKEENQIKQELETIDFLKTSELIGHKNALDYMPKYVLKQIAERRHLNTSASNVSMPSTMTPYSAHSNNGTTDNSARESTRRNSKSNKLQAQLLHSAQVKQSQQQSSHVFQQVASFQMHIKHSAKSLNGNNHNNQNEINHTNSKINEEHLAHITTVMNATNGNGITNNHFNGSTSVNNISNNGTNLFSTAFISMGADNPNKTQFEKLANRAAANLLHNSNSIRQKITK